MYFLFPCLLFSQQKNIEEWAFYNTNIDFPSDYCFEPVYSQVLKVKSTINGKTYNNEDLIKQDYISFLNRKYHYHQITTNVVVKSYNSKLEADTTLKKRLNDDKKESEKDLDICSPSIMNNYNYVISDKVSLAEERFFKNDWVTIDNKASTINLLNNSISKFNLLINNIKNIDKRKLLFLKNANLYRIDYHINSNRIMYYVLKIDKYIYLVNDELELKKVLNPEVLNIRINSGICIDEAFDEAYINYAIFFVNNLYGEKKRYQIIYDLNFLSKYSIKLKTYNIEAPKIIGRSCSYMNGKRVSHRLISAYLYFDNVLSKVELKVSDNGKVEMTNSIVLEENIYLPKDIYKNGGLKIPM